LYYELGCAYADCNIVLHYYSTIDFDHAQI
jgi:hypothetical protein